MVRFPRIETTGPDRPLPDLITAAIVFCGVLFLEKAAGFLPPFLPRLALIGLFRILQSLWILFVLWQRGLFPAGIGLSKDRFRSGIRTGILASALFGVVSGVAALILFAAGHSPFSMIRVGLPHDPLNRILFFLVGGVIAPVAEELFFRGILFGTLWRSLRRFGLLPALLFSTAVFALLHPGSHIPQAVGGFVFCLAYAVSGSLLAPILIHAIGNLVLFSLPLLVEWFPFLS